MKLPKPYYDEDGITIYCGDCRDILPHLPKVDLVLTDPPYGIAAILKGGASGGWGKRNDYASGLDEWDKSTVDQSLIEAVVNKGERAIVWGGHLYTLPPMRRWLIWDKKQPDTWSTGQAELAWTNIDGPIKTFRYAQCELATEECKMHPTQKPLKLFSWCMKWAPKTKTVLDPFMGSGTTLVAAKNLGLQAIGIEISEEYCKIAVERLAQKNLFTEVTP